MNIKIAAGIISLLILVSADEGDDSRRMELADELSGLRKEYQSKQEKLQRAVEQRWSIREKNIKKKQRNKNELEELEKRLELLNNRRSRITEKIYMQKENLKEEEDRASKAGQDWERTKESVDRAVDKTSELNSEVLVFGIEKRMAMIEEINKPGIPVDRRVYMLADYWAEQLKKSGNISLVKSRILTGNSETEDAQILRISNYVAYGMTEEGEILYLLPGKDMEWKGIENQEVGLRLADMFPDVIETDSLKGNLPIDVLRTDQSEMLLNESSSKGLKAGIVSFAEKGGVVLIPLALIIIWALFLIIERLVFYGLRFRIGRRSVDRAVELIESGKFQEAKAVTAGAKGIMPEIFNEIVSDAERTREDAERRVKERLLSEVPKLDKHLDTIAVLAAASPLLGLLGTVTGMIDMFDTITRFGTREPQLLAGGISEALVTTETGLIIAIPLLIIHNFLRNRRNSIQTEMERNSVTILNRIWPET